MELGPQTTTIPHHPNAAQTQATAPYRPYPSVLLSASNRAFMAPSSLSASRP